MHAHRVSPWLCLWMVGWLLRMRRVTDCHRRRRRRRSRSPSCSCCCCGCCGRQSRFSASHLIVFAASRDHAQYRRRARRGRSWSYRSGERGPPVPSSSRRRTTCRTTGCCPRRTRHRHCLRVSPGEGAAGPWGVPGVDAGRSVRSRGPEYVTRVAKSVIH